MKALNIMRFAFTALILVILFMLCFITDIAAKLIVGFTPKIHIDKTSPTRWLRNKRDWRNASLFYFICEWRASGFLYFIGKTLYKLCFGKIPHR